MRVRPFLLILSLVGSSLLAISSRDPVPRGVAASEVATTDAPATRDVAQRPVAGDPPSPDAQALQQQIVGIHGDLLRVLQRMALLEPERQKQIGGMMVDLMPEVSGLLVSMQPVRERMTPSERADAVVVINEWRIRADIEDMLAIVRLESPAQGRMSGMPVSRGADSMDGMGRQMGELHLQTLDRFLQLSPAQMQGVAANMVDLSGNLDRLRISMGPAFDRLSPDQRQMLRDQMDAIRTITQEMLRVAEPVSQQNP